MTTDKDTQEPHAPTITVRLLKSGQGDEITSYETVAAPHDREYLEVDSGHGVHTYLVTRVVWHAGSTVVDVWGRKIMSGTFMDAVKAGRVGDWF